MEMRKIQNNSKQICEYANFSVRILIFTLQPKKLGNYQKIIHFLIFSTKKVAIKIANVVFVLDLVYIFDYVTLIADFDLF